MRPLEEQDSTGAAGNPPPTKPAEADLLRSAGQFTNESRLFVQGLASTFRTESRLNVALAKSVLVSGVVEFVGWILAWAILLGLAGSAIFVVSENILVAFSGVAALQLGILWLLALRRRRRQKRMGFSRTRELVTGTTK